MSVKIKRYLIEMANDIKEKIRDDECHSPEGSRRFIKKIDTAIYQAKEGWITSIETIGEILAAYDDFVSSTYQN